MLVLKQGMGLNEILCKFLDMYFDGQQSSHIILQPKKFIHVGGNCWCLSLPVDFPSGDEEKLWTNKVLFKENDVILGPAHTVHNDIILYGKGCYSHWGRTLFFSSSDNSNPRINNRLYKISLIQEISEYDFFPLTNVLIKENVQPEPYVRGRVLLVNDGLGSGGTERQVVNTLLGLQNQELESVSLLCMTFNNDFYLPYLKANNVTVHHLANRIKDLQGALEIVDEPVINLLKSLSRHFVLQILNLILEFKHRKPEIVHAWLDNTSIICGIAGLIAGVPKIILSSRSMPPFNFALYSSYMKPLYMALSKFDNIIFLNNSERGAREYCQWLNLPLSRFKTIRNGVDFSYLSVNDSSKIQDLKLKNLRTELGIPENSQIVGSIFRFSSEKQPLLWIKIAIEVAVKHPNVHFILVGKGVFEQEMKDLVKSQNMQDRFHFLGEQNDISRILPLFDVFLLTSECEGTPNVILEAQWLGVPVIALDAGGVEETILHGITGKIEYDSEATIIAESILNCLEEVSWRNTVKHNGPEFIAKRFGLERMIKETMEAYGYAYRLTRNVKSSSKVKRIAEFTH